MISSVCVALYPESFTKRPGYSGVPSDRVMNPRSLVIAPIRLSAVVSATGLVANNGFRIMVVEVVSCRSGNWSLFLL